MFALVLSKTTTSLALALLLSATGSNRNDDNGVQGYVEGEFVYVASPMAGALRSLSVDRGAEVKAGDPLFVLDDAPEKQARDEAERQVAQARATLADIKKGKRPSEIESLQAQLGRAKAALELSQLNLVRMEKLAPSGSVSKEELDRARSQREQDAHDVAALEADLTTAGLGQRPDQIAAAEAEVRAREAALAKADWNLSQKQQAAPLAGLVFDVLYRPGEWVAAGRPVVALLPPGNIKVRAFVPETRVGAIHPGDSARVIIDGVATPATGKISYISPQAEYTPPVIYSRETRAKLVFMVEIVFDDKTAATLHPGQPVDVQF